MAWRLGRNSVLARRAWRSAPCTPCDQLEKVRPGLRRDLEPARNAVPRDRRRDDPARRSHRKAFLRIKVWAYAEVKGPREGDFCLLPLSRPVLRAGRSIRNRAVPP